VQSRALDAGVAHLARPARGEIAMSTNMQTISTIDLDQLITVTGGQNGGFFENAGRQVGQAGGQAVASVTPAPVRPIAQQVLPPVGREVGGWAGRQIDNFAQQLPRLW
jgi:hypothetical protein